MPQDEGTHSHSHVIHQLASSDAVCENTWMAGQSIPKSSSIWEKQKLGIYELTSIYQKELSDQ